jgi:hypothetical protein
VAAHFSLLAGVNILINKRYFGGRAWPRISGLSISPFFFFLLLY